MRHLIGTEYSIIGPNSMINQGVGIDIGSKTAIAVSIERDPVLEAFVRQMKPAYDRIARKETRREGLIGLAAIVNCTLKYNQEAVVSMYREDFQSNQAIVVRPLGEFITAKKGICFQRALLAGVSLEYAKNIGIFNADTHVSVESEHNDDLGEYHALVRFCSGGELWCIDSAQQRSDLASFVGLVKG